MPTFALYNLKGGVGKTAASVNLAYLSAADGKKTLLWDLDPQGAASYYFQVETAGKNEFKKILSGNLPVKEIIRESAFENLWIIPSDMSSRHADLLLDEQKQSRKKLKSFLHELKGFDHIFMDCPPGLSILHENVFLAAGWVLMPNIPTTLSILSFDKVIRFFEENNIEQEKIKCFFSMVDHRKNLHHEIMQKFYRDGVFLKSYIPYLSDVEKMGTYRQPLFEFANSGYAATCFRDLWNEIKKKCL
ncbi:MAG: AAA family ATPase [Bacteroidetes bacterium]|nr:AAA family ATPase [Bacteroidota bacterium]